MRHRYKVSNAIIVSITRTHLAHRLVKLHDARVKLYLIAPIDISRTFFYVWLKLYARSSFPSRVEGMPIAIETSYVLKVDGAPVWKIPSDVLKHVDGEMFIRLRPWDFSLIRLVLHGTEDSIKKKQNPSLAQTPGWQAFLNLRNEAAFQCDSADAPARSLFGVEAQ